MNLKRTGFSMGMALIAVSQAHPAELLTNGGFENGMTGWSVLNQTGGSGDWYLGSTGAYEGNSFAFTQQDGPGAHVLFQSFTIPEGAASVSLSFALQLSDSTGFYPNGSIDYNVIPSQFGRVDIMTGTANVFSTNPLDVVDNLLLGANPSPDPWALYNFDLSSLDAGAYVLRFVEVDNQFFFNEAVDAVSLLADESAPVPEVQTYASLFGVGLIAVTALRRRRAARA